MPRTTDDVHREQERQIAFHITFEKRGVEHRQTVIGTSASDAVAFLRADEGEITVTEIN